MSDLTSKLQFGRPSRKLCIEAANRIAELEDALLQLEAHAYSVRPLKTSLLDHVQNVLYERRVVDALNDG